MLRSSLVALILVATSALRLIGPAAGRSADDFGEHQVDKEKAQPGFGGRTGKEKARLLKEFGGNEASEEAVMLGLAWLTQTQKKDGSWDFDGPMSGETAAATGLSVLSFLGAGQSHQAGRYQQTVKRGLDWLVRNANLNAGANRGKFTASGKNDASKFAGIVGNKDINEVGGIYSQGIATLALCEAIGLTHDKELLPAAQAAIDYIQSAQSENGSWGYSFGIPGDVSIAGFLIQALHAATLAQEIKVDERVLRKAVGFLDYASSGPLRSRYGYMSGLSDLNGNPPAPATNLTAIGLLLRYYIDGWRTKTPGFADGVKGLMTRAPRSGVPLDMYFYYYATQVVRFHGGEAWQTWNEGQKKPDGTRGGGSQDWLINLQVRTPEMRGSWPPDVRYGKLFYGRLGTTALCLLTLEVYYRYTPENANEPR